MFCFRVSRNDERSTGEDRELGWRLHRRMRLKRIWPLGRCFVCPPSHPAAAVPGALICLWGESLRVIFGVLAKRWLPLAPKGSVPPAREQLWKFSACPRPDEN